MTRRESTPSSSTSKRRRRAPSWSSWRPADATSAPPPLPSRQLVRELVLPLYAKGGRHSIDPVIFFKLQLVLFFENLRSERQLMEVVADRLSLRWYLGYDLDERLPDHSSLTKIRERYGPRIFRRFFERIVEMCVEAGLVRGEELFTDATKVEADAAVDSLAPRWFVEAHLHDLFEGDAGEDEKM